MIQKNFADKVIKIIKKDKAVIGLAAGGSWIKGEIDEFSDLDLVLVTKKKISNDKQNMFKYAHKFGNLLSAFTGEHVGDPRLLICLYDQPLLHVDIKFLTLDEFDHRVENPVILFETGSRLTTVISSTKAFWPIREYQWFEDRFWIWVHIAGAKLGRGEYYQSLEYISFLRINVIAPLIQIKHGKLPFELRRVEFNIEKKDLEKLESTVAKYDHVSILRL